MVIFQKENDMGVYIELPKEWAKWSFDVRDIHDNILEAKVTDLDLVRCGECEHWNDEDHWCNIRDSYGWNYKPNDFCSYGERRTDYTVFTVNTPKGIETPLKGDATVFHKNSKMGEKVARPTATSSTEVPWWKGE